jgi:hypothetical protein
VLWVWLVRRRDKKGRKEDEAGKASRWNTLRYESWTGIRTERATTCRVWFSGGQAFPASVFEPEPGLRSMADTIAGRMEPSTDAAPPTQSNRKEETVSSESTAAAQAEARHRAAINLAWPPLDDCSTAGEVLRRDDGGAHRRATAGVPRRVKSGKAPRQPWHLRQPWQLRVCKLQILQGLTGFESHPLRHPKHLKQNELLNPMF